jgi:hypothetical protein
MAPDIIVVRDTPNLTLLSIRTAVNWTLGWAEAIGQAGSDSHPGLNLWTVAGQYQAGVGMGTDVREVLLAGFPAPWRPEEGAALQEELRARPIHPRTLFALGAARPHLYGELRKLLPNRPMADYLGLVTYAPCTIEIREAQVQFVPRVWLAADFRECRLYSAGYIWQPYCWLAMEAA